MNTTKCTKCDGNGINTDLSAMFEIEVKCGDCCGFGWLPVEGIFWFYKMRSGGSYEAERIASMVQEPDGRWRVTHYAPCGPIAHQIKEQTEVMAELRNYKPSRVAPKMLDVWSLRKSWIDGTVTAKYVAMQRVLDRDGFGSITDRLAAGLGLTETVEIMREFLASYKAPGFSIWSE